MHYLKKKRLERRTFLKGTAGITVGLPILDIMLDEHGEALAQTGAFNKKFLIAFAGNSFGVSRFDLTNNDIKKCAPHIANNLVPKEYGPNYYNSTVLKIFDYYPELKDYATLVSNLTIPETGPASFADQIDSYHAYSAHPVLFGIRYSSANSSYKPTSMDHLVGAEIQGNAPFKTICFNGYFHPEGKYDRGKARMSLLNDVEGSIRAVSTLWDKLFKNFNPGDTQANEEFKRQQRRRLFILDQIKAPRVALMNQLGKSDQLRMEQFFEEINNLDAQIKAFESNTPTDQCVKPDNPGGGSGQGDRIRLARDLLFYGMQCDLVNSTALMQTKAQSRFKTNYFVSQQRYHSLLPQAAKGHLNNNFNAHDYDFHEVGHSSKNVTVGGDGRTTIADLYSMWTIDNVLHIAERMRQTQVGNSNMLDNAGIIFMFESGCNIRSNAYVHTPYNHIAMVIGKAGGKLKTGVHIDGKEAHPAEITLTVGNALAPSITSFNEVNKIFTPLKA